MKTSAYLFTALVAGAMFLGACSNEAGDANDTDTTAAGMTDTTSVVTPAPAATTGDTATMAPMTTDTAANNGTITIDSATVTIDTTK